MGSVGQRAVFEALRSINSTTITGTYQALGSPLSDPAVLMKIVNNSTMLITISYDGVTDHDVVPGGFFTLYDFGSDAQSVSGNSRLFLPASTQVYVKGTAGTGLIYLVVVYAGG